MKVSAFPPYIGIIEDNVKYMKQYQNDNNWDEHGYQLSACPEVFYGSDDECEHDDDYECKWNKDGDILEMTLNLNERTLSFALNDEDYGNAVRNIKQTKYRLALSVLKCIMHLLQVY